MDVHHVTNSTEQNAPGQNELNKQDIPDIQKKWGSQVAKRGFAQIPNYLLLLNNFVQDERKLSSTELLVVIQLVGTWWRDDQLPFLSLATIAKRCGISNRHAHRCITRLDDLGFIKRVSRRDRGARRATNSYDLLPLAELLERIAGEFPNPFERNIDKHMKNRLDALLTADAALVEDFR